MKLVPNAVSLKLARTALQTRQASPQMLFVGGLIGMSATIVLACRATLSVEEILETHEIRANNLADFERDPLSTVDIRKEKAKLFSHTTIALGKLYGPAILCGSASVVALAGSNNILTKRNAGLIAAYGTLEKAFEGYRDRVREAYGEDREQEIYHGVEVCEFEDPETGKKTKRKIATGTSPYAKLYGPYNQNYEQTPEANYAFLKLQQNWATQRLQARGHLFLNEVYETLGFPHTTEGAVVGWLKGDGDGFVDFGIFNAREADRVVDFMVGREQEILLDFNVDGMIYKKI